jgi:hypothetical protein
MALLGGFVLSLVLLSELVGSAKTAQGPFNLVASDSSRYVQLNWDADFGTTIQGYNIYRSLKTPDRWEKLNETVFPLTTYVDYSAPRSELVFYRVNYVDGNGQEIPSAPEKTIEVNSPPRRAGEMWCLSALSHRGFGADSGRSRES